MYALNGREFFVTSLLAMGILMIASPWVLNFSDNGTAAASASGIGALFLATAYPMLWERPELSSAGALSVGGWSLIVPFLFGFIHESGAFAMHIIVGAAAMVLAVTTETSRPQGPPEIRV
jgi:hypothetical protein